MKKILELRKQRANAINQAKAIRDGAKAAEREITEDEAKKIDELLTKADAYEAEALGIEAAIERDARLNAQVEALGTVPAPKAALAAPQQNVAVAENQQLRSVDDPNRGYSTPREMLNEIITAARTGIVSDRLKPLRVAATAGSDEQGGYADPYGGFLLPVGFSPDVLKLDAEPDRVGGLVTRIPMNATSLPIPARVDKDHSTSVSGGLTVTRRAEADTGASSRMQFEKITFQVYNLFGLAYATEELLTDSPISFAALLAAGFKDEFNSHILEERLSGTGVGEFLGIMNSPALIGVTKETGQAADTITYENIVKMRARIWGYENAVWMANNDCIPQLSALSMPIGTGGIPMWVPSAREDIPNTLFGRPLIFTEYCQTIGDKGDLTLANWTQYLEGVYQQLQSAESIHVRFIYNERAFRFTMRNAGAPWWRSALTPKNSTSTLSPFVTLNAR